MTDPVAPNTASESSTTPKPFGIGSATPPGATSLYEYLSLRKVPWSLAYIGFLCFIIAAITYIANIGLAAMVVALFGLLTSSHRTRWPLPVWLFLIFWIWAALATALSDYSGDLEALMDLGKVFLVFLVAVNVLWNRLALRLFILIYIGCYALFPVRGTLFNYFIYNSADFGRPSWIKLFGNPNDLAGLTILALALVAGFLHRETPRTLRFAALLLCLVFPFIVLLTQSRGAFIGMGVFLLLSVSTIGRNRIRVILAIVILGTAVIAAAPSAVWERIAGLQDATSSESIAEMDGSAVERWEIAQTAFRIIADHPFVGVGLGRAEMVHGIYNPKIGPKSLHNTYLDLLVQTGVPGLVLFLWHIALQLVRARRRRGDASALYDSSDWRRLQLLEFGLWGYLVAGIWGSYGFLSMLYVYLAILFAQTEALGTLAQATPTRLTTPLLAKITA